jgi:hypothetical protein
VAPLDAQIAGTFARRGRRAGDTTQSELESAGPGGDRDANGRVPAVTGAGAACPVRRVQDEVHAHTPAPGDGDLAQPLPAGRGHEATPRGVLWHLAGHCIRHQGHIGWLRAWAGSPG